MFYPRRGTNSDGPWQPKMNKDVSRRYKPQITFTVRVDFDLRRMITT